MNNGNEFLRLKKEKRAWCEKNHGESKEEKQNIKKKKLYPYLVIENLGTLKQRKKNPMSPREIVYHIENNQDYIDTIFSNSCNRCKKEIQ